MSITLHIKETERLLHTKTNMKTWFKFYGQEFLTDPKMLSLTPIQRALWTTMLCLASSSDEEGVIKYIDESKIMQLTNISPLDDEWNENEGFLDKFVTLSMITRDNNVITLLNFNKRQESNLSGYERVKKHRAKKKVESVKTEAKIDDNVIIDNARIEKNRIEKNRKDINVTNVTVKTQFGNQDVNEILTYFKEQFHLEVLDLSIQRNRYAATNLLRKYKDVQAVKALIDMAALDDFWGKNITSTEGLLNNAMKIYQRAKGDRDKVAVQT